MVRLFVRHPVSDYATWREHYDAFDDERRGMGVTGDAVFRSVDGDAHASPLVVERVVVLAPGRVVGHRMADEEPDHVTSLGNASSGVQVHPVLDLPGVLSLVVGR